VAAAARKSVPLALRVRHRRAGPREVYVGNAAQALHPVAGQGLNLGLRDAWDLADLLTRSDDPGAAEVLARYAARRRLDRAATVAATDSLARLFVGSHALLGAARGIALSALDIVPPARRFFARRMIFGASALP
jgi:2-octaprenyl-6-methoxyphenol hydroxylase